MKVRHLVAAEDVDANGFVVDASRVRHGTLRAGAVYALAGPIDPMTHLNLDFPDHACDRCVIVERLEPGARVVTRREQLVMAQVPRAAFAARGWVNVGERRAAWLDATGRRA